MKKKEALVLAPQKVDVIMEYVTNILDDSEQVCASINFNTAKINGESMCVIDIYVPIKKFERHLNLGITSQHSDVIFRELLDRIIMEVLPSEVMGATKFYHLRSTNNSFDGINIVNQIGSQIKLNMYGIDRSISDEYNQKYDEYENSLNNEDNISMRKI